MRNFRGALSIFDMRRALYWRRSFSTVAAFLIALVILPGSSFAAIVSYQFEGVWNAGSPIYSGTNFDGVLSFDTSQVDQNASSDYGTYSPLAEITFYNSIGTMLYSGQNNYKIFTAKDYYWYPATDDPYVGFSNGISIPYFYSYIILNGDKNDDSIFPIFSNAVNLAQADVHILYEDLSGEYISADGYLTSFSQVSPVPLPPALPAFAAGLALFGFLGWRKTHTWRV